MRFARLMHRGGRVLGGPAARAAFGGIPACPGCHAGWYGGQPFRGGLLSCHGDTARTADLPSLPNLWDHDGPGRTPALPDVPTVNELGFSGFDDLTWTAFFAPAGMPSDLVNRINSEVTRALSAPEVRERLTQLGLDWRSNTSGEFAAFLREEVQKWAKAVKDSGAKAD